MRLLRSFILIYFFTVLADNGAGTVAAQSTSEKDGLVGGKTLEHWIAILQKDRDISLRQQAIRSIINFGAAAKIAVPALIDATKSFDASVRGDSAAALGMLGGMERGIEPEDAPKVITALANLASVQEQQRSVRLQATLALAQFGSKGKAAIPSVLGLLQDTQAWEVRKAAAYCLGRIGMDPRAGADSKAVQGLIGRLSPAQEPCAAIRLEAIMALSAFGLPPVPKDLQDEIRALTPLLDPRVEPDKSVQIWARVLLMFLDDKMTTPQALPQSLAPILKAASAAEPDAKIRSTAYRALGILGPKAGPGFINNILGGLRDRELDVILTTIGVIAQLGENARPALDDLEQCFKDPEAAVRAATARTVPVLGELGKPLVPKVRGLLNDKDDTVIFAAISALAVVGDEGDLANLKRMAETHKNEAVQKAAEQAIKLISERVKKK